MTVDVPHTGTVNGGQEVRSIGTSTFSTVCNDPHGYSVYAIGYTGDEEGNTDLRYADVTKPYIIPTGVASSNPAVSYWNMHLSPVSGAAAPTIENGFDSPHVIPSDYTEVASLSGPTGDGTTRSAFTATYDAYAATTQVAGTYTGKVRYLLVHPEGAPTQSMIIWNANGGTVSPATSTLEFGSPLSTLGDLPTPTKDGYIFLGWFTALVGGEEVTSSTIVEGDTVYYAHWEKLPNSFDIAFANASKSTYNGTDYYAMQDMSASICGAIPTPTTTTEDISTQLIDTRDNKVYWVNKLLDGNCWMTQNLDFVIPTTGVELKTTDSNVEEDKTLTATNYWNYDNISFYEGDNIYLPNGSDSATNITCDSTTNGGENCHYHVGNYYNWPAATAGSGTSSVEYTDAPESICPKGWRLPTSNSYTNDYSFGKLTNAYGITNSTAGSSDANLLSSPLWFVRANDVQNGKLYSQGISGDVWSSWTGFDPGIAYLLSFSSIGVYPSTRTGRDVGLSVRCVAE